MRRVVAIVGATATGKTALGEALAAAVGGEVVCADARQVYRGLEIGSGAPTPAQRAALPHHLFGALAVGGAGGGPGTAGGARSGSAGWYARAARAACEEVFARGRTAVLVGGSGLWIAALRFGLHGEPPHDPQVRARLLAELERGGPAALHARLTTTDPVSAARLRPGDRQRIVRALEVYESSGRTLTAWREGTRREGLEAEWRALELACEPRRLRERIARRTQAMFAHGLIEETRELCAGGARAALEALRAIGYDEALALLDGRCTRAEAEERTTRRTAQLAKRQRTWFRHQLEAARLSLPPAGEAGVDEARRALRL